MSFYGSVLSQGKKELVKIPVDQSLTLSKISIDFNKKCKGSVQVRVKSSKTGSKDGLIVGVLSNEDPNSHCVLNYKFTASNSPVELWMVGEGKVHVVGAFENNNGVNLSARASRSAESAAAKESANTADKNEVKDKKSNKKRKIDESNSDEAKEEGVKKAAKLEPPKLVNMKKAWNVKPQNDEGVLVAAPKTTFKVKGLKFIDYVIGNGAIPKPGATIKVVYTGLFPEGSVFDARLKRTQPLVFRKGVNQVVKGLDLGMEGMKIGGSREITIPAELGYGEAGMGSVPGGQTLIFRITLLA